MAGYWYASPGGVLAICAEPCEHEDCKNVRAAAAKICPVCREPIGFERRLIKLTDAEVRHFGDNTLEEAHEACMVDWLASVKAQSQQHTM